MRKAVESDEREAAYRLGLEQRAAEQEAERERFRAKNREIADQLLNATPEEHVRSAAGLMAEASLVGGLEGLALNAEANTRLLFAMLARMSGGLNAEQ